MELSKKQIYLILAIALILIIVTFATKFYGQADTFDYQDSAKFFAGEYPAKIRLSHSYLYGLMHAPMVGLTNSFFIFKITSLISLFLIVYSVYLITGKNKRAPWLMLLSPIVWYMAPWASPIQLASLCFLWGYHFTRKYGKDKSIKSLFYAGMLIGLSWAFWDGALFFIPLFLISFFYNEKLIHSIYFVIFIIVGSLPRVILDTILFGFPFFTPLRHIMASLALTFLGGFYSQGGLWGIVSTIFILLFLPLFAYLIFIKRDFFKENRKPAIFILLSILLLIINSQIRFILLMAPIIIVVLASKLTDKQFNIQLIFSVILILLVLNPYVLQTHWDLGIDEKGIELSSFITNAKDINLTDNFRKEIINEDLSRIASEFPDEIFIVGNLPDDYRILANFYTGDKIKEFVSIEDYNLSFSQEPIISKKELCSRVKINERRDVCFAVWIRKAFNDDTDYSSIKYAISLEENLDVEGFDLKKKYETLTLWEKADAS